MFQTPFPTNTGTFPNGITANGTAIGVTAGSIIARSTGTIGFSSTTDPTATADVLLRRDGANILAQRNGTTAQEFRIYSTFTDPSNKVYGGFQWSGGVLFVQTNGAGTGGSSGAIAIYGGTGSSTGNLVQIWTKNVQRWNFTDTGHLITNTDAVSDIGASGASRPRDIFISGGLTIGATTLLTTTAALTNGAAAQNGTLTNAPTAGNPTKWISINDNGTTRYIPCW